MATWTYFTAYLDGARPIRKVERDELYSNLAALLTATGCSSAGYSLNSTDQSAITGSNLLTDRASLDGPGATNTKDRLHTILETASGVWPNYATAVYNALAAEGLTATTRGNILSSNLDDHRLWNYYRRVIDALTCPGGGGGGGDCDFDGASGVGDSGESDPTVCFDDTWDVTGQFEDETELELEWNVAAGTAQIVIKADGVTIYTGACEEMSGSPLPTDLVTVPAGTESLQVIVTCSCDAASGGSVAWSLLCPPAP